jgi:glutathione S-transferase
LPVLIDLNGSIVSGIYAVIEYLEEAYGDKKLVSSDIIEAAEARRIFQWMNEDFSAEVTAPIVFEKDIKRFFSKDSPSSVALKQTKAALDSYIKQLNLFIERRNWLAGDNFSIADISAAAHISVVDYLGGISWSAYQTLKEWYMRVKSRPSFKRLLADRVPGLPPASYYANLDF